MLRRPKFIIAVFVLSVALLTGWLAVSNPAGSTQASSVDMARLEGSAILDGLEFSSMLGPSGKPYDVDDTLVFENGMFLSTECYETCDYPPQPYYVRHKDEGIEFISETRCPHKDAKIVWRGTVKGDTIEGEFTWTISRWYWTIEKSFHFEGTLAQSPASSPTT